MFTEADLPRLREKEKQDKIWFKRYLVLIPTVIVLVGGFVMVDVGGTKQFPALATVRPQRDTWSFKHGQRCQNFVITSQGETYFWTAGLCSLHPLVPGTTVDTTIRVGRLTHWIWVGRMAPHH